MSQGLLSQVALISTQVALISIQSGIKFFLRLQKPLLVLTQEVENCLFLSKIVERSLFLLFGLWFGGISCFEHYFVALKFVLEAIVGTYNLSFIFYIGEGLLQTHGFSAHQEDKHESCGLHKLEYTLDMPAAQWTRMLPFLRD